MDNDFQTHSDTGESVSIIPERSNVSVRASQPQPRQSGRIVATERPRGDRYPQAENFGWKQPVYPTKPATPSLQELQQKLSEVDAMLTEAGERYESERHTPDTRALDLQNQINALTSQLTELQAKLEAIKAEGTPLDRISRAIDKAEKSVAGIAGATIESAATRDAVEYYELPANELPRRAVKDYVEKYDIKLRRYRPELFIQLSGKTLTHADVEKHGSRVSKAIEAVSGFITKLLK